MSSTRRMRSPTRIVRAPGGVALSDMQALFRQQQEFMREQTAQVLRKQDLLVKALQQVYDLQNQTVAAVQQTNRAKSVADPGVTEALRQLQQTVQQQSAQQTNEVRDLRTKIEAPQFDAAKMMEDLRAKTQMDSAKMMDEKIASMQADPTTSGRSVTKVSKVVNGVAMPDEVSEKSWGAPDAVPAPGFDMSQSFGTWAPDANVTRSGHSVTKVNRSVNGVSEPEQVTEVHYGGRKSASKKPSTKKPETKKPATKKPETKKPATKKPETKKPATKKPTTKKAYSNLQLSLGQICCKLNTEERVVPP